LEYLQLSLPGLLLEGKTILPIDLLSILEARYEKSRYLTGFFSSLIFLVRFGELQEGRLAVTAVQMAGRKLFSQLIVFFLEAEHLILNSPVLLTDYSQLLQHLRVFLL
jgi:hypothetical protein